jgi:hypothetical protein
MNSRALCIIGLCGIASTALSQNFSLSMESSDLDVNTSSGDVTIAVTVTGDADVGDYILGGSFGIESNNASIIDMQWEPADWSQFNIDGGYAGNGNYNETIFGQLILGNDFPPPPDSLLGNAIGTFMVTFAQGSLGRVDLNFVEGDPFTLSSLGWPSLSEYESSDGTLHLSGLSINLIPAPGTGALLTIGAMAITRRRR